MPETVLFDGVRVEVEPPLPTIELAAPVTTVEVEPPTPRVKVQRPVPLVGVAVTTPDPSVLVAPMRGPAGPEGPEGPQGPAGSGGGVEIDDATTATTTTWSSSKIDGELDGRAPTSHAHAQSDVTGLDTTLAGKSDTTHTHDYAATTHTHDDRYYTEAEVDTALAGKAAASHGHVKADISDFAHTHTRTQITDAGTAIALNAPATGDAAAGEVVLGSDSRLRLKGTGSPEGVVTAAVGTSYVDSAATNGAILWVKASGTGNTGWEVAQGDTGLRNITSLLPTATQSSNPSLRLFVRRIGRTVTYTAVEQTAGTASGTIGLGAMSAGFDDPDTLTTARFAIAQLFSAATGLPLSGSLHASSTNGLRFLGGVSSTPMVAVMQFITVSSWPTTLPGTAA